MSRQGHQVLHFVASAANKRMAAIVRGSAAALTRAVLKSYLLDMPRGHIFDLTYRLFADVFPPGAPDASAREPLHALAGEWRLRRRQQCSRRPLRTDAAVAFCRGDLAAAYLITELLARI